MPPTVSLALSLRGPERFTRTGLSPVSSSVSSPDILSREYFISSSIAVSRNILLQIFPLFLYALRRNLRYKWILLD